MGSRKEFEAGASFETLDEIKTSLLALRLFGRTIDKVSILNFAQDLAESFDLPDDTLSVTSEPLDMAAIKALIEEFGQMDLGGHPLNTSGSVEEFFRSAWDIIMPPRSASGREPTGTPASPTANPIDPLAAAFIAALGPVMDHQRSESDRAEKARTEAMESAHAAHVLVLKKIVDSIGTSGDTDQAKGISTSSLSLSNEKAEEVKRNTWDSTQSAESNFLSFKRDVDTTVFSQTVLPYGTYKAYVRGNVQMHRLVLNLALEFRSQYTNLSTFRVLRIEQATKLRFHPWHGLNEDDISIDMARALFKTQMWEHVNNSPKYVRVLTNTSAPVPVPKHYLNETQYNVCDKSAFNALKTKLNQYPEEREASAVDADADTAYNEFFDVDNRETGSWFFDPDLYDGHVSLTHALIFELERRFPLLKDDRRLHYQEILPKVESTWNNDSDIFAFADALIHTNKSVRDSGGLHNDHDKIYDTVRNTYQKLARNTEMWDAWMNGKPSLWKTRSEKIRDDFMEAMALNPDKPVFEDNAVHWANLHTLLAYKQTFRRVTATHATGAYHNQMDFSKEAFGYSKHDSEVAAKPRPVDPDIKPSALATAALAAAVAAQDSIIGPDSVDAFATGAGGGSFRRPMAKRQQAERADARLGASQPNSYGSPQSKATDRESASSSSNQPLVGSPESH